MRAAVATLGVAWLLIAAPAAEAGLRTEPVIPPVDGAVAEHVRAIADTGAALGNSRDVFAKVGDSISESGSFLTDLACEEPAWGRWSGLAATREYFGLHTFPKRYASVWCGRADSFSRASVTAVTGWDAADALAPMRHPPAGCERLSPLACEYRLIHPAVALVMYGTNDVESFTPSAYRANLGAIVESSEAAGVIPVLSTFPPRLDKRGRNARVVAFNRRVVALAAEREVPLWNYWRALQDPRMVHHGIGPDGIHPNLFAAGATDFTQAGLRYGYNQRNLGALRVLERIRAVVAG